MFSPGRILSNKSFRADSSFLKIIEFPEGLIHVPEGKFMGFICFGRKVRVRLFSLFRKEDMRKAFWFVSKRR